MKFFFVPEVVALASTATLAFAQTNAPSATPGSPAPAVGGPPKLLIFHAPSDVTGDVMPIRVGGGSRGGNNDGLSVQVLVPDQVALTTQAQPSLYWYQSKPAKTLCEVSVTEPKNPKPLLLLKSGSPTPAGIHAIRLTKFKTIELKPNVLYRWSIAVVVDPANRSLDIVANGVIKRIEPSADLAAKLAAASEADKPGIYAENGIWYDALQAVSDQIDKAPKDDALLQERASLLKQVGLDGASLSQSP
jgi:hypothetical protein